MSDFSGENVVLIYKILVSSVSSVSHDTLPVDMTRPDQARPATTEMSSRPFTLPLALDISHLTYYRQTGRLEGKQLIIFSILN